MCLAIGFMFVIWGIYRLDTHTWLEADIFSGVWMNILAFQVICVYRRRRKDEQSKREAMKVTILLNGINIEKEVELGLYLRFPPSQRSFQVIISEIEGREFEIAIGNGATIQEAVQNALIYWERREKSHE